MRLLDGVDVVGSGWLGFSLSDHYDSHVYLLHDGGTGVLVDSGCGRDTGRILHLVAATGLDPASIRHILLTHCHADHAGGAAALARVTGATILGSAWTARVMAAGDEDAAGLVAARAAGGYPQDVRLTPAEVEVVEDGSTIAGTPVVKAIGTPGHARGHLCYLAVLGGRRLLFTGDLVFARGRVAVLGTPDTDVAALSTSLDRLAATRPDVLLPGHGTPVLSDAAAHIDAARDCLRAGLLPPGLLR